MVCAYKAASSTLYSCLQRPSGGLIAWRHHFISFRFVCFPLYSLSFFRALGLALLFGQTLLGRTMKDDESKRTVHAYLGTAIMGALVLHGFLGLQLALSTA